jgi:hypothetical protein
LAPVRAWAQPTLSLVYTYVTVQNALTAFDSD